MTNNQTAIDPFMDLRLAYLRVIARSWEDTDFRNSIISDDPNSSSNNRPTKLRELQPILQAYGMVANWPNLGIYLVNNPIEQKQTRWSPELTGGWIGCDDRFEIGLPRAPLERLSSLAAYYQMFPDLMGRSTPIQGPECQAIPTSMGSMSDMLAFGGVVLRAIALAWTDNGFRNQLLEAKDATDVLSEWLGYNSPYNFELRFLDTPDFKWDETKSTWAANGVINKIVLNYPNPPSGKANEQYMPIALTSYNNTGPAYPFSC